MINNILDYLDQIVKKHGSKDALIDDESTFSFLDLYNKSRSIGCFLASRGFHREPILIFMEKCVQMPTAFLGVIQAGCFYVPLDTEMPALRIRHIIENCRPRAAIVRGGTENVLKNLAFQGDIFFFEDIESFPAANSILKHIRERAIDTDPIYIVFTSGSTGIPKGVCACHRSVIDYAEQLLDVLSVSENTVFGCQSPLYFDACLKEIMGSLKFGATTYLIPPTLFSFPIKLVEYLNDKKINTICWVVSALTIISAHKTFTKIIPKYLKMIAFGSEVFPVKQFKLWRDACKEAVFINLYGPTEGTGMCCYHRLERSYSEDEPIPIGRPFKNTEILLLKDDNTPAADGEAGEICLRGTCVTLGYYNNHEKTAESFVQNPLNTAYPEFIYRTGDIAKKNQDGDLVFISRKDSQIKHMGHRIELGEIEVNTALVDGVILSGCIYDIKNGKIVLYYTGTPDTGTILRNLKEALPRFMVPNRVKRLEEMPLTPNGKVDRSALLLIYEREER